MKNTVFLALSLILLVLFSNCGGTDANKAALDKEKQKLKEAQALVAMKLRIYLEFHKE